MSNESEKIESSMQEDRRFPPSDAFVGNARIKSPEEYQAMYRRSVDEPEAFWAEFAESAANSTSASTASTATSPPAKATAWH